MDGRKFHEDVYGQDYPTDGISSGWVQWKGTDVCIDLHCVCGYHGHVDGEFFYFYECAGCGVKYAVGSNVKLIPLTPEQVAHVETETTGFVRDEEDCEAVRIAVNEGNDPPPLVPWPESSDE